MKRLFLRLSAFFVVAALMLSACPNVFDVLVMSVHAAQSQKSTSAPSAESGSYKDVSQVQAEFTSDAKERSLNLPGKMAALRLVPGTDFLAKEKNTDETLTAEIKAIVKNAQNWSMNTLIVETTLSDGTLLQNQTLNRSARTQNLTIDPVTAIIDAAKANNLYVLCVLDLTLQTVQGKNLRPDYRNTAVADEASGRARQFAKDYHPDGVLFTGWENKLSDISYAQYLASGSGIGFANELMEQTRCLIDSAAYGVQITDFSMAIGLWCDPVWVNNQTDKSGSATKATHQMKTDDYLNLPTLLEHHTVDFLVVDCPGSLTDSKIPLTTVAKWWKNMATKYQLPVTLLLHNEKLGTGAVGFASPDQVVRQVIAAANAGISNVAFASLSGLAKNWQGSTDVLKKHLASGINTDLILKDLYMTRPAKSSFVTYDNSVLFTGTGDPNFPLTLNGKKISVDEKGNFATEQLLKIGKNTFTFAHKSTSFTYTVQKKVLVLKEASPLGSVKAEGGTTLSFTMKAYRGASCYATLGSHKITLTSSSNTEEADRESAYVDYFGSYTLPKATYKEQNLGQVAFYASYLGMNESKKGGSVIIQAKEPDPSESVSDSAVDLTGAHLIKIIAKRAETFRTTTLDNWADCLTYDYPGGTYDFVASTVTFTDTYGTPHHKFTYYNLKSGRRVYDKDYDYVNGKDIPICETITDKAIMQEVANNHINKTTLENDGRDTVFTFEMNRPVNPVYDLPDVTYAPSSAVNVHPVSSKTGFAPTYLSLKIPYVNNVPNLKVPAGSLFSKIEPELITENGARKLYLKCYFKNGKAFSGADAYVDKDGRLVLTIRNAMGIEKANNSFGYTLKGVKIAITPGHGGGDPGASGFKGINEVDLNFAVADLVGEYLTQIGAEVVQLPRNIRDNTPGLIQKMKNAQAVDPDILLCLHHNAGSSTATGVETYYYTAFTYTMAKAINDQIAKDCGTYNRGAKMDVKYMTRDMTFPAILLEYGFVSNPSEFAKLADSAYQQKEARATVKGIINYILSMQP